MDNFENAIYSEIALNLEKAIVESGTEIANWDTIDLSVIERSESNLDPWDFCFSIAIGLVSPSISTNEDLNDYLKEIHNAASEANGEYDFLQKTLGALLHHKGDPIDQIDHKFIKRDKENAWVLFHRLLWGHDIFSIKSDNPFYLMIKKQGLSGIIQAVQHLLADTTSKQGLPFPGSSYFDFVDENGDLSNYLIKLVQQLSVDATGSKRLAQEMYSRMFTIRAADMLGGGSATTFNHLYFRIRAIKDEIRKQQFNFISYSISFWGQALVGAGKLGVPFINFPVGAAMIKSFVALYAHDLAETRTIKKKGILLEQETARIARVAEQDYSGLKSNPNKAECIEEIKQTQDSVNALLQLWEEIETT